MGKQLAGARETALDLVEDHQHAVRVAQGAKLAKAGVRNRPGPALALHGLQDHRRRGGRSDRRLQGLVVTELQLDEAGHSGTEALQVAGIAGRVDRRQGPAMEGAVKADNVDPLLLPPSPVELARRLDGALDRLGSGVGEEDHVGEGLRRQGLGQLHLLGDGEDIGHVPQLVGLGLEGRDQLRMGMAERIHGNARQGVEVGLAVSGVETHAFASRERQGRAAVHAHQVVGGNVEALRLRLLGHDREPSKT